MNDYVARSPDEIILLIFKKIPCEEISISFVKQNDILQAVIPSHNRKVMFLMKSLCTKIFESDPHFSPLCIDKENLNNWQIRLPMTTYTLGITKPKFEELAAYITKNIEDKTSLKLKEIRKTSHNYASITHNVVSTFVIQNRYKLISKKFKCLTE